MRQFIPPGSFDGLRKISLPELFCLAENRLNRLIHQIAKKHINQGYQNNQANNTNRQTAVACFFNPVYQRPNIGGNGDASQQLLGLSVAVMTTFLVEDG